MCKPNHCAILMKLTQRCKPTVVKKSEVTQSCPTLCDPVDCSLPAPPSLEFSRQEYWSWLPFPSPEDLPTTLGSNPGLPHCRQMLYHLSHQGCH